MFKFLLTCSALIGLGTAGYYAYPHVLLYKFSKITAPYASQHITIKSHKAGLDYIMLSDIALDQDHINTVQSIAITFSPLDFLTQGKINSAVIKGAELVASVKDNNSLLFDGWLNDGGLSDIMSLSPERIIVQDSDVSLLTEAFGGISGFISLTANKQPHNYSFTGQLTTQQKHLKLSGYMQGSFSSDHFSTEYEFDRGRLELPDQQIKLTRLNGKAIASYNGSNLNLISDIQAGGMRLSSLPWANAAMSYTITPELSDLSINARALGAKDIELSLSIDSAQAPDLTISAPSEAVWNNYIQSQDITGEKLADLVAFLSQLNAKIELQ